MLVLYSDGVTEANDVNQNEYDEERFIEVLKQHRTAPASELARRLPIVRR
jgi:serine phosphatase RsbU (regulator of sigma subunit)